MPTFNIATTGIPPSENGFTYKESAAETKQHKLGAEENIKGILYLFLIQRIEDVRVIVEKECSIKNKRTQNRHNKH
jgi:hypothetical protein